MKSDEIRGKETTKTDKVLEFLVANPNKVFSPSEIGEVLDIDVSIATTVLSRLASEGVILKEERGQYMYESKIKPDVAEKIVKRVYNTLVQSIGQKVTDTIINTDFMNTEDHLKALKDLRDVLEKTFGKMTAQNMIMVTVRTEFDPEPCEMILRELDIPIPGEMS